MSSKYIGVFADKWMIIQVLGEGAFGEVKLLEKEDTKEILAVKVLNNAYDSKGKLKLHVNKEIGIQRKLPYHPNIIRYLGCRADPEMFRFFIFLEYINGGELFDKISEPNHGLDLPVAQRYFRQIISAVEFLHNEGIVHRDIKPENMLLDMNDNIKIIDFGMATMFRNDTAERELNEFCGSPEYMAPEVYCRKMYKAQPVDIWSCGVVLFVLLSGEQPWGKPVYDDKDYLDWTESAPNPRWFKIDSLAVSMLRKILMSNVSHRYTIEEIKNHQWFKKDYGKNASNVSASSTSTSTSSSSQPNEQLCVNTTPNKFSFASQPVNPSTNFQMTGSAFDKRASFSQPARPENMFLSTQMPITPPTKSQVSQTECQKLVRRMTRFIVNTSSFVTKKKLVELFEKKNYSTKNNAPGELTITTKDRRRMDLSFKANIISLSANQILVDFRLSRGNGIEFKRHFVSIRNDLSDIIVKGPITWPLAFATNTLP